MSEAITVQIGSLTYAIGSTDAKYFPVTENGKPAVTEPITEEGGQVSGAGFIRHDKLLVLLASEVNRLKKLWLEPSEPMVQAGLAEVQRILDEWESDHLGWCVDDVTDDMASDMAVFVSQAMAGKLNG